MAACRELSVVGVGKKCGEAAWASELLPCKQAFKRVACKAVGIEHGEGAEEGLRRAVVLLQIDDWAAEGVEPRGYSIAAGKVVQGYV